MPTPTCLSRLRHQLIVAPAPNCSAGLQFKLTSIPRPDPRLWPNPVCPMESLRPSSHLKSTPSPARKNTTSPAVRRGQKKDGLSLKGPLNQSQSHQPSMRPAAISSPDLNPHPNPDPNLNRPLKPMPLPIPTSNSHLALSPNCSLRSAWHRLILLTAAELCQRLTHHVFLDFPHGIFHLLLPVPISQ